MKRNNLFFICLFFFATTHFFSQKMSTVEQIDKTISEIEYETFDDKDKDLLVLCTELYYKSKEINYEKGQARALIKLSFLRLNAFKDHEKIIKDSKEVEKIALSLNNYGFYSLAQVQRAWAYMQMDLLDQSENTLKEAAKSFELIEDRHLKHAVKTNYYFVLACIYDNQGNSKLRKYYDEKLFAEAVQMDNKGNDRLNWILNSSRLLIGDYLGTKEMDKAEYYLKVQEKYIKQSNNFVDWAIYHKTKAEFEFENKAKNPYYIDSTLYHFKKAEFFSVTAKRPYLTELVYQEIANVYSRKNDSYNQAAYLKKARDISDSLAIVERFNNKKLDIRAEEKKDETEADEFGTGRLLIYILIIILLLVPLFLLVYKKYVLTKKNNEKTKDNFLGGTIEENTNAENPITLNTLRDLAFNNDGSFHMAFQRVFPDFDDKLLHISPSIKATDIEFCAFMKLKIETKQIATIKNVSVRAVENKKYRIRKKLNIATSEDIYIWMQKI